MEILSVKHRFSIVQNWIPLLYKMQLVLYLICILLPAMYCNEVNLPTQSKDLFKKLFKMKRAEQLEAVKKMTKIEEGKQIKMVKTVTKTIFDILQKSRTVLENSGYTPGVSEFPESESVREALSLVVENTALLAETVLRLPDVTERVLRSTADWSSILGWGLTFVKESRLLDSSTNKLFNLVSQELNFTARDPDYINPYRKVKHQQPKQSLDSEPVKKKKKPPLPRGPRLTPRQEL